MSSSRAFLRAFLGLVAAGVLAALGMTLLVDPYGVLAPTIGTPTLCPPGNKSGLARQSKLLVPAAIRPRTVLLGTSRVMLGFDAAALERLGPDGANMGVENAQPRDFVDQARAATAWGKVERAYIGADFAAFLGRAAPPLPPAPDPRAGPRLAVLADGLFSIDAVRAAILALRDCRARFAPDGSPFYAGERPVWLGPATGAVGLEAVMQDRAEGVAELSPADSRRRMAELAEAIRIFRRQGAQVTVFIAPYAGEVVDHYRKRGLGAVFDRWMADVAAMSRANGAHVANFATPAGTAALGLPACAEPGPSCHFHDHIHYDRSTGTAMAEVLARTPPERPAS